jgi:hypothetical protein
MKPEVSFITRDISSVRCNSGYNITSNTIEVEIILRSVMFLCFQTFKIGHFS